jgi:hypothetical protein
MGKLLAAALAFAAVPAFGQAPPPPPAYHEHEAGGFAFPETFDGMIAGYGADRIDPDAAEKAPAEEIARGSLVAELAGASGLAADPSAYCRAFAGVGDALAAVPHATGTVYRAKADPARGWILPLGANGLSAASRPLGGAGAEARSVVYANRLGTSHAALFARGEPSPSFSLYFASDILAEYNEGLLAVPIP